MGSAENNERRRWRRGASRLKQLTLQTADDHGTTAVVLNESLTGVSLAMQDGAWLAIGQEVQLRLGQRMVPAIVRHIRHRVAEGDYHVGLEWGPCEVKPASLLLMLGGQG